MATRPPVVQSIRTHAILQDPTPALPAELAGEERARPVVPFVDLQHARGEGERRARDLGRYPVSGPRELLAVSFCTLAETMAAGQGAAATHCDEGARLQHIAGTTLCARGERVRGPKPM